VEGVEGIEDGEIKPCEGVEGMAFAEQAHPGARGGPEKNRAGDVA
jgi:hypothetical protein